MTGLPGEGPLSVLDWYTVNAPGPPHICEGSPAQLCRMSNLVCAMDLRRVLTMRSKTKQKSVGPA